MDSKFPRICLYKKRILFNNWVPSVLLALSALGPVGPVGFTEGYVEFRLRIAHLNIPVGCYIQCYSIFWQKRLERYSGEVIEGGIFVDRYKL